MCRYALVLGIFVNFLWGVAFLIPYALPHVDPLLIAVGRYVTYGCLSIVLLFALCRHSLHTLRWRDWLWAVALAATGNIGYYAVLVLAIRLGGVPVTALIIGTLPVTIALYGNLKRKEFHLRRLVGPLTVIAAGLVIMNAVKLMSAPSTTTSRHLLWGMLCAFLALVMWTWYGVANAHYLKRRPEITGQLWSAAVGAATLILMAMAFPLLAATGLWSPSSALVTISHRSALLTFVAASLVLGVVVSWAATVLWNIASRALPVSLAGQLVVFETISSIAYGSIVDRSLPDLVDILCMVLVLVGVLFGIRVSTTPAPATPTKQRPWSPERIPSETALSLHRSSLQPTADDLGVSGHAVEHRTATTSHRVE